MKTERTLPAWPEDEPIAVAPPINVLAVGAMRGSQSSRRRIRRIAVVRDTGPHIVLYAISAALLVFLAFVLLSGLVRLLDTVAQLLASVN